MKQVTVKYFASSREAVGRSSELVHTSAANLGELRDELVARGEPYAGCLVRGKTVRMALDQVMQDETALLASTAEVAFFPPVTGG